LHYIAVEILQNLHLCSVLKLILQTLYFPARKKLQKNAKKKKKTAEKVRDYGPKQILSFKSAEKTQKTKLQKTCYLISTCVVIFIG